PVQPRIYISPTAAIGCGRCPPPKRKFGRRRKRNNSENEVNREPRGGSLLGGLFHLAELFGTAQIEDRFLVVAALLVQPADPCVGGRGRFCGSLANEFLQVGIG